MGYVIRKRPVDAIEHALDFTGYLPTDTDPLASAVVKIVGEDGVVPALLTGTVTVASPQVTVKLLAGTAIVTYQVYVTATTTAGLVKRLQFEVAMTADPEG